VASGEWRVASEDKTAVRRDAPAERDDLAPSSLAPRLSPLFLIGPRGSGKTTIARLLAQRLGWEWVDADELLEARFGKSIRRIFEEEGEAGFRDKESAILADLCGRRDCVVSTGGGVVVREANRMLLRASGWVVWLTADADTLWRRLQDDDGSADRRPMLTVGGRAEIEHLLGVREPWYRECAHLTVHSADRAPEAVVDEIFRAASQGAG
jgi:shikimate kinase